MNNYQRILLYTRLGNFVSRARNVIKSIIFRKDPLKTEFIGDIDYFPTKDLKLKRALIALSPDAWLTAKEQFPNIKLFNVSGITFEIVKSLNLGGYIVDITSYCKQYLPVKSYDVFIGHGGFCKTTIDNLHENALIFQYVAGMNSQRFEEETNERYQYFNVRNNSALAGEVRRSLKEHVIGDQLLNERSDALFTINCPRMISSYGPLQSKFYFTGYGAYIDPLLKKAFSNYEEGVNNFLYVGGTGGNIIKGLDILIDAFKGCPESNLYIYCKVEPEILAYYRDSLNLKNIHYIFHWSLPGFKRSLQGLLPKINYTIHAPCNFGMGTAFMASLGAGYIPVGYIDYPGPPESAVLSNSWLVEDIQTSIRRASEMSPEWCDTASKLVKKYYRENCTPKSFSEKFSKMIVEFEGGFKLPAQSGW